MKYLENINIDRDVKINKFRNNDIPFYATLLLVLVIVFIFYSLYKLLLLFL